MRKFLSITAAGCCALSLTEAGSFKWHTNKAHDLEWTPAQETPPAGSHQPLAAAHPAPTSPAELRKKDSDARLAAKRTTANDPNVCGYVNGQADDWRICASDSSCLLTTVGTEWVAACCPTTSLDCPVQTACLDSTAGSSIDSTSTIDLYSTLWCNDPDNAYCAYYTYGDVRGYSMMDCMPTPATNYKLIDYNTIATVSSTTTTPGPPKTPTVVVGEDGKPPVAVGPIVGGVVGGVAVIALLILGLVFLLRKKRNDAHNQDHPRPDTHMSYISAAGAAEGDDDPQQGPAPGNNNYHYQPVPMQQQYPPAGYDDYSGKPPYSVSTNPVHDPMLSPTGSTSPRQQDAAPTYQPPAPKQHQHQQTPGLHEMPAVKGDGNLNELA